MDALSHNVDTLGLSPESSPGRKLLSSGDNTLRSTSVLQGSEMYKAKTLARHARIQAQVLHNRIETLKKKEEEARKAIEKSMQQEQILRQLREEKEERWRERQQWKEEQNARVQQLRLRFQNQRQDSLRRKREAFLGLTEQRRGYVAEARLNRSERDASIREFREQERRSKMVQKLEIRKKEMEVKDRTRTAQTSNLVALLETYSQQVETQKKIQLDAMQEAAELQKRAGEALEQYYKISQEKSQLESSKSKSNASPFSST